MKSMREILSSPSGTLSSKRTVMMICVFLLVIGFFSCFFTDRRIPEYMWNTISYIIMTGLGFTGVENATNLFKSKSTEKEPNSNV